MPRLTDLNVEFVSLVDRAAQRDPENPTQPQKLLLWKAEGGATPGGDTMTDSTVEDLRAQLEKAEQERDAAQAERDAAVAKAAELEKDEKPTETEIDKAELPENVRVALEKAEAISKAADERAEKAEALAKAERDTRITAEFTELAKSQYGKVGGDAKEFGAVLKAAKESLPAEQFEVLERQLKAAEAKIDAGDLFAEIGKSGETIPEAKEPQDAMLAKAEELRKADTSLTQYQAMEQAMRENPEAARQYLAAIR